MKVTKKILAVVLAAAMLITIVAVGASAAAVPTNLKFKLDVTRYDTATNTSTPITDGKVNRGDMLAVTFYLGADRNLGEGQVLLCYDNTVYTPVKETGIAHPYTFYTTAGANSKANVTKAAVTQGINPFWADMDTYGPTMYPTSLGPDPDGYNIGGYGYDGVTEITGPTDIDWYTDSITFDGSSNVTCKTLAQWQATYPVSWQNAGATAAYANPTNATQGEANRVAAVKAEYLKYNCYRFNYIQDSTAELNFGGGYLPVPSINNPIFTIYLKVKDDAAFTSADIFIPESEVRSPANTSGKVFFATYDSYMVSMTENVDQYLGKTYDLTEISTTLTVVDPNGGGSEAADKEALQTAINAAPTYGEAYYTAATWSAYQTALTAANDVLADEAATQDAVDTATTNLTTAFGALATRPLCSYTALDAAIATSVNAEGTYTAASWQAYQTALTAAQNVSRSLINDANGSNQAIVDTAKTNLTTAIANLETISTCDYSQLNAAIFAASPMYGSTYYTTATWNAYQTALTAANNVPANLPDTGSNQADINTAATNLNTAFAALQLQPECSYTALDAAIAATPTYAQAYYTATTWSAYANAKAAAQAVERNLINDTAGVNQAVVDDAKNALVDAFGQLATRPLCSYTALDAAIATSVNAESTYTAASWQAYQTALTAAQGVSRTLINDADGANQATVDTATSNLTAAIANLETIGDCDYSQLTAALALTPTYTGEFYTSATWDAYAAARTAALDVPAGLADTGSNQADINAAAATLTNAFNALEVMPLCDYTALDAAIAATPTYAESYYTDATWSAFATALTSAEGVSRTLIADRNGANALIIESATTALTTAYNNLDLRPVCDYTALDAAIATTVNAESTYTAASWQAYQTALTAANGVARSMINDKNGTNQGIINAAKNALDAAIDGLESIGGCNYTALDAAIVATPAYEAKYYTQSSWQAYTDALTAAQAVTRSMLNDEEGVNQGIIDDATGDLTTAFAALALVDLCNYADLEAAIADTADRDDSYYTEATWNAYAAAKAAGSSVAVDLLDDRDGTNQGIIDAATDAITTAKSELELMPLCDYTALDAAIATTVNAENTYTAASWQQYQSSLSLANAVSRSHIADRDGANQALINGTASNLLDAIDALESIGGCSYTALDAAIAVTPAKAAEYYTATTWAAYQTALTAAQGVTRNMLDDEDGVNQGVIDAATADLTAAIAALDLVELCDYAALDIELAKTPTYGETYYTADTWSAYTSAKAAATAIARDLLDDRNGANQALVDAAQSALATAFTALATREACSYTALDAAIAATPELSQGGYTTESWNAYANALALAQLVTRNLINDSEGLNQAIIDEATADLTTAFGALEVSSASITSVAPKTADKYYTVAYRDYDFAVNGRPIKIQIVDATNPLNTRTYTRNHPNVSIISYDAQGDVCDPVLDEVAKEVWSINARLPKGDYYAISKNDSNVWELSGRSFEIALDQYIPATTGFAAKVAGSEDEAAADLTIELNAFAEFSYKTNKGDVEKVQLVFASGATSTYTRANCVEGTEYDEWTITRRVYKNENGVASVKVKCNGAWIETGDTINITFAEVDA